MAVILANLFSSYVNPYWGVNLAILIGGLIVGWVREGIIGGLWNATVTGAFCFTALAIILIIGSIIFDDLAGFAAALTT